MKAKSKKQLDLLRDILATADLTNLPQELRDRATEAIADIGGCAFCGRAATLLCDFCFGVEIDETHRKWPVFKSGGKPFTCDAPLCEQCRVVVGMTTITGVPEAIDYCPHHATDGFKEYLGRPMTKHDAEKMRIATWKRALFV